MSSSVVAESSESNNSENNVILIINNEGKILLDEPTLQKLLVANQGGNASVSVVRVNAAGQLAEAAGEAVVSSAGDESQPQVNLTVEGYFPPASMETDATAAPAEPVVVGTDSLVDPFLEMDPEQLQRLETALQSDQAKEILGENVTAMLDMLTSEDDQKPSVSDSIRMDHCYSTCEEGMASLAVAGPSGAAKPAEAKAAAAPPAPPSSSKDGQDDDDEETETDSEGEEVYSDGEKPWSRAGRARGRGRGGRGRGGPATRGGAKTARVRGGLKKLSGVHASPAAATPTRPVAARSQSTPGQQQQEVATPQSKDVKSPPSTGEEGDKVRLRGKARSVSQSEQTPTGKVKRKPVTPAPQKVVAVAVRKVEESHKTPPLRRASSTHEEAAPKKTPPAEPPTPPAETVTSPEAGGPRKMYPKRENRKPPAHLAEAFGPALFSTPDIPRRISDAKAAEVKVEHKTSLPTVAPPESEISVDKLELGEVKEESNLEKESLVAELQAVLGEATSELIQEVLDNKIELPEEMDVDLELPESEATATDATSSSSPNSKTGAASATQRRRSSSARLSSHEVKNELQQLEEPTASTSRGSEGRRRAGVSKVTAEAIMQLQAPSDEDEPEEPEKEAEEAANSDGGESWNSEDDPDRLWCICRKPHNNRFMICCDRCEEWFHGQCVGITKSIGQQMEQEGREWSCPPCRKIKQEELKAKLLDEKRAKGGATPSRRKSSTDDKTKGASPAATPKGTTTQQMCIVCKKVVEREDSIYCSTACILKHAQDSTTLLGKDKPAQGTTPAPAQTTKASAGAASPAAASPAAGGKVTTPEPARLMMLERRTGKLLTVSSVVDLRTTESPWQAEAGVTPPSALVPPAATRSSPPHILRGCRPVRPALLPLQPQPPQPRAVSDWLQQPPRGLTVTPVVEISVPPSPGANAPTVSGLRAWLQEHPTYEVVSPSLLSSVKSQKNVAPTMRTVLVRQPNGQSTIRLVPVSPTKQGVLKGTKTAVLVPAQRLPQPIKAPPQGKAAAAAASGTAKAPASPTKVVKAATPGAKGAQAASKTTPGTTKGAQATGKTPVAAKASAAATAAAASSAAGSSAVSERSAEKSNSEPVRISIRKTLKEVLLTRVKECKDLKVSDNEITGMATAIEEELFNFFKETNSKYKAKYRTLLFNIKDAKNHTLYHKIVTGDLSPEQLVRLSPEELATKELAQWRERETQHALEMIKKSELELMNQNITYVMKTHKGEQLIETDDSLKLQASAVEAEPTIEPSSTVEDTALEKLLDAPTTRSSSGSKKSSRKDSSSSSRHHSHRDKDRERGSGRHHEDKRHSRRDKHSSSSSSSRSKSRKDSHDSKDHHKDSHDSKSHRDSKSHSRDTKEKHSSSHDRRHSSSGKSRHLSGESGDKPSSRSSSSLSKTPSLEHSSRGSKSHKDPSSTSGTPPLPLEQPEPAEIPEEPALEQPVEEPEPPKSPPLPAVVAAATAAEAGKKVEEADLSDREPSSTVTIKTPDSIVEEAPPPCIWKGSIFMTEVAKFQVTAHEVSGTVTGLGKALAHTLEIVGRIPTDTVWDYISKMKKSGTKEIVVLRLNPASNEEKAPWLTLYQYLSKRNRFGVVKNKNPVIKDFYLMPLSSHAPVPQVLLPLDGPGFEESRPHTMLGIIVRARSKRAAEAAGLSSQSSKPSKTARVTPASVPERSYTPPLPESRTDSGSYTPPLPSVKLPGLDYADQEDAPYSPGDASGGGTPPLPASAAVGAEFSSELEELNRKIEEQKMQIASMSSELVNSNSQSGGTEVTALLQQIQTTALLATGVPGLSQLVVQTDVTEVLQQKSTASQDDEDEAYSPSRSISPPSTSSTAIPGLTLTDTSSIMLPSNLQEILASIQRKTTPAEQAPQSVGLSLESDPIVRDFASADEPATTPPSVDAKSPEEEEVPEVLPAEVAAPVIEKPPERPRDPRSRAAAAAAAAAAASEPAQKSLNKMTEEELIAKANEMLQAEAAASIPMMPQPPSMVSMLPVVAPMYFSPPPMLPMTVPPPNLPPPQLTAEAVPGIMLPAEEQPPPRTKSCSPPPPPPGVSAGEWHTAMPDNSSPRKGISFKVEKRPLQSRWNRSNSNQSDKAPSPRRRSSSPGSPPRRRRRDSSD